MKTGKKLEYEISVLSPLRNVGSWKETDIYVFTAQVFGAGE